MTETLPQARSGINTENLQEMLDAGVSAKHATMVGQAQYESPVALARFLTKLLPARSPWVVFDPQCARGNLLDVMNYSVVRFGFEIDNRMAESGDNIQRVVGNCVKAWEALDDVYPNLDFDCSVANPPFGLLWPMPNGSNVDSTEYTWRKIQERTAPNGYGYFIASWKTIEKLNIHKHKWVFLYQKFPKGIWENCDAEIGVVHFHNSDERFTVTGRPDLDVIEWTPAQMQEILDDTYAQGSAQASWIKAVRLHYCDRTHSTTSKVKPEEISAAFKRVQEILDEEKKDRPPFNIYLDKHGMLRTYLSTRLQVKRKLSRAEIIRVEKVNNCHPYALAVDKETRKIMTDLVACGVYTIQPEAKAAIDSALSEMSRLATPIMPVTPFESVAYADEAETLTCKTTWRHFKAGVNYSLTTATYKFVEKFKRKKPHYNESTNRMYVKEHECTLTGQDRYIAITDSKGNVHKFMDRPNKSNDDEHEETMLWEIFERPTVLTVADLFPELIAKNTHRLKTAELLADFTYYPGQLNYIPRMGVKNYGLVGAATGTGKSLMALSLIQLKGPKRALIIAPQGTMRASEDDDDDEGTEFGASQWVNEIRAFVPGRPVFELFSLEDYERIVKSNNGTLPNGIYISYYQAMFTNGARESVPETWDDLKLAVECQRTLGVEKLALPAASEDNSDPERYWCDTVGHEQEGIRCIIRPCLATVVGHLFDFIAADEAHIVCNLDANVSQMLIRLQPTYRYLLTATPIPNIVLNLFCPMGWLCVPEWFKGKRRNVAWPYAREDLHRFADTFMSMERDFTQEEMNEEAAKAANKKRPKSKCEKMSSVISSPARLLKIIKPTMAYISKKDCRPDYTPAKMVDIRVPMGQQQMKLYAHYLNRGNIPAKNPLVRARLQLAYMRAICADPYGFSLEHSGPKVTTNMNPKTIAIMELVRDMVKKGDQFLIINARIGQTDTYACLLKDCGVKLSRIDSTTGAENQSHQANIFKRGDTQGCLIGIKCAAAWSFNKCPNAIIGSIEYAPGPLEQACGRIDRINSECDRTIYCVLHKLSYEEIMHDTVATKDDAAKICLLGQRTPRTFKPLDMMEVMADTILKFDSSGGEGISEKTCTDAWPALRDSIKAAL